jgi:hypothetical protein
VGSIFLGIFADSWIAKIALAKFKDFLGSKFQILVPGISCEDARSNISGQVWLWVDR